MGSPVAVWVRQVQYFELRLGPRSTLLLVLLPVLLMLLVLVLLMLLVLSMLVLLMPLLLAAALSVEQWVRGPDSLSRHCVRLVDRQGLQLRVQKMPGEQLTGL